VGGDGYEPQIDPVNPNIIYGQWQYGNIVRYDKQSGEITGVQPQPDKDDEIRWNWDTPLIISPHNHQRLYVAANVVYRSDDMGNSWKKISGDLSRKINRDELPVMGKVWGPEAIAKNASTSLFGNIISLAESPIKENLIFVGTDDGLVQVTENSGESWIKFDKFPGVPETTYVSDLYPSRHNENVLYATFNNHKNNDFKPYILKSNDKGKSWISIAGDLPTNGPLWTIEEDTKNPDILFVGSEFGLFTTLDGGKKWIQLKGGFPSVAVRDLDIQESENDLVVGTFGRGIYIIDDYTPLREINKEMLEKDAFIFPIKDALMFQEDNSPSRRNEGESFYRADNPPVGAVFTYYLKESVKTKKDIRIANEKELRDAGKPVTYPTFAELRAEDEEDAPFLIFTINDNKGNSIRNLTAPATQGLNRLSWDMRYASQLPPMVKVKLSEWSGFPVVPGEYFVSISLMQNGIIKELTSPSKFVCKPLNNVSLPASDKLELKVFQDEVANLYAATDATNKFIKDVNSRIELISSSLKLTTNINKKNIEKVQIINNKLKEYSKLLNGDASISKRNANQVMSISDRIGYIIFTMWYSSSKPTETNRSSFKIASEQLTGLLKSLKETYENDILPLEKEMDNQSSPWTPGRFPVWK